MTRKKKFVKKGKFSMNVAPIVERQTELGKKYGLVAMTPPPPELLFDPTGRDVERRSKQWYSRAGLESGRYLETKNETFIKNYLSALNAFPDSDYWKYTIERMKNFIKEKEDYIQFTDFLGDVFPPLSDWYPSNKGYTKGKQISYKDNINIDLSSKVLRSDIEEVFDIFGTSIPKFDEEDIKKIVDGQMDVPTKYIKANMDQIEEYLKDNNILSEKWRKKNG